MPRVSRALMTKLTSASRPEIGRAFRGNTALRSALSMAAVLLVTAAAYGHEPITTKLTWSREISRIIYKRCASCHRPGGPSPMSLLTYEESRPWAVAIKEEVTERRMPPWGAVKGFGDFKDDQGLSQEEISRIVDWVEGGAPAGEDKYLPSPPHFHDEKPVPPRGRPLTLRGSLKLAAATTLIAIRPSIVPEGSSLRVTAQLPDGSIQPMLWLRDFKPRYKRIYSWRAPLRLPMGTVVSVSPPGDSTLTLLAVSK